MPSPLTDRGRTALTFLEGARVKLRTLVDADADGPYVEWLNDPVVCAGNSHHLFAYTRERAREYIARVNGSASDLVLAIERKSDGAHVGNISLTGIHPVWRKAEFGILVGDRGSWGQGIGLEASELIVHHGFTQLNLHRIECGTFAPNQAMRKLAAALGMREEGLRRDGAFKDGAYLDIVEFGVLRDEFLSARESGQPHE